MQKTERKGNTKEKQKAREMEKGISILNQQVNKLKNPKISNIFTSLKIFLKILNDLMDTIFFIKFHNYQYDP